MLLKDEVQLAAIADTNAERVEKYVTKSGAKLYSSGFEMLEKEELDIVDICLPTFLHAEYAIKAMERVKYVIVEKAVCLKEEEAQQMLEAQEKTGALVQVAHVVRFARVNAYRKKLVSSGEYGKVVAGSFSRFSSRPLWMRGFDDIDKTGGMALDLHIHDADFIRHLMGGDPDHVSVQAVRDQNGLIQHIWSTYRFGEALIMTEASWDYPFGMGFTKRFRIKLEKAAVVLSEAGVLTVYPETGGRFVPKLEEALEMDTGMNVSDLRDYLDELKYMLEVIRSGDRNGILSLSEAVASFRLVMKEQEAAKIGE
ncbi:MAG: Gfo/Idh/MocA family oxidoreductase [Lachnospiraceae bacterium]|nr:Gfo/Idh/MocA family oxidoreductase [Lachnospiraceae bacterium]